MKFFPTLLAVSTLVAAAHAQVPGRPVNLRATPDYASTRIVLRWERSTTDETGFEIFRSTNGGALVSLGFLGAGVLAAQDTNVNTMDQYAYVVRAFNASGSSPYSNRQLQNLRTIWPVPASHEMLHSLNEPIGSAAPAGFHAGIDIQRRGSQNEVLVARGGLVASTGSNTNPFNRQVSLWVWAPGGLEYHTYAHLHPAVGLRRGMTVQAGDYLGRISQQHFTNYPLMQHLHFQVDLDDGSGISFTEGPKHHPLDTFLTNADRDPQQNSPAMVDHAIPEDGSYHFKKNLFPAGPFYGYSLTHPLEGDMDIIVEMADRMGTRPDQVPTRLGYWIEGTGQNGNTSYLQYRSVRSAAQPYILFEWSNRWFGEGLGDGNLALHSDIIDEGQDYSADWLPEDPWPNFKHFFLTHASNGSGDPGAVKSEHYWNTDAAYDSAIGETHDDADGWNQADTTQPTEARFPDADYTIHVLAADMIHGQTEIGSFVARSENFHPVPFYWSPTGDLPSVTTVATGSMSFSESMEENPSATSMLTINNGASIPWANWITPVELEFLIVGLEDGKTYTVTALASGLRDRPGDPGNRDLDGNGDGTGGDNKVWTFSVLPGEEPTVSGSCDTTLYYLNGEEVDLSWVFSDADDGDILEVTADPDEISFIPVEITPALPGPDDDVTAKLDGCITPGGFTGTVTEQLVLSATDLQGHELSCTVDFVLRNPIPVIGGPCDQVVDAQVGVPFTLVLEATDETGACDPDQVQLDVGGLPGWLSVSYDPPGQLGNPVRATLSGTPGPGDVGRSTVIATGSDYAGQTATCQFRLKVSP